MEQRSAIANNIEFDMKTVRLEGTADPYKWWPSNSKQFPVLAEVAMVYFAVSW